MKIAIGNIQYGSARVRAAEQRGTLGKFGQGAMQERASRQRGTFANSPTWEIASRQCKSLLYKWRSQMNVESAQLGSVGVCNG